MSDKIRGTVLVVDDEEIIREVLELELRKQYNVFTAKNAIIALNILKDNHIDLVISDINMPGIKGFELLNTIKKKYPGTKTALITSYNINDYIRMAKKNDISNIISKSVPFNFDEFNSIVKNLVTEQIFGLENYMLPEFDELGRFTISNSAQITEVEEEILSVISGFHDVKPYVNILLEELITNAVYHAPVDENGKQKYRKHSDVVLEESEVVNVCLCKDSEKYGISVADTSGKLTKQQVLHKIDRHINEEGLLDEDGRGLHISRIYSDRLIINIKKDVATEAIILNYLNEKYKGYKPLYINEL